MSATGPISHTVGLLEAEYIRRRTNPRPGELHYLHLVDLLAFIKKVSHSDLGRVLDYGCGGSPYRSLLSFSEYTRADFPGDETLDYILDESMVVPAYEGSFDTVLSTQVLEHVAQPGTYLDEARRVTATDGRLILTTHGTFIDHGCPHDYQRWTADGLANLIEKHGFRVEQVWKLTTGPRAAMFVNEDHWGSLWDSRMTLRGWAMWLFRKVFTEKTIARDQWFDARFSDHSVVPSDVPGHPLYIAIGVLARAV